jgi:hypothetical protein
VARGCRVRRFARALCIKELRDALDDADHAVIKTEPRRGYVFAAEVRSPSRPSPLPRATNQEILFSRTSEGVTIAAGSGICSLIGAILSARRCCTLLLLDITSFDLTFAAPVCRIAMFRICRWRAFSAIAKPPSTPVIAALMRSLDSGNGNCRPARRDTSAADIQNHPARWLCPGPKAQKQSEGCQRPPQGLPYILLNYLIFFIKYDPSQRS